MDLTDSLVIDVEVLLEKGCGMKCEPLWRPKSRLTIVGPLDEPGRVS